MIDFNCFIGTWAFHPTLFETIDQLKALHEKNGITMGYVSSLKSATYRDYFFSEEELHNALQGTGYRQIMTVDPRFPACLDIVRHGVEHWDIAGVRVIPGFHGYSLADTRLEDLCVYLQEKGLPLYMNLHMEDDRSCYLVQNIAPTKEALAEFLAAHHGLKVLLCNASFGEVNNLKDAILAHPAAFFDMSGMRNMVPTVERLGEELQRRLVLGTMAPLLCTKSALLHLEKEEIKAEIKDLIVTGSAFV